VAGKDLVEAMQRVVGGLSVSKGLLGTNDIEAGE